MWLTNMTCSSTPFLLPIPFLEASQAQVSQHANATTRPNSLFCCALCFKCSHYILHNRVQNSWDSALSATQMKHYNCRDKLCGQESGSLPLFIPSPFHDVYYILCNLLANFCCITLSVEVRFAWKESIFVGAISHWFCEQKSLWGHCGTTASYQQDVDIFCKLRLGSAQASTMVLG